jgi:hypothetical protein
LEFEILEHDGVSTFNFDQILEKALDQLLFAKIEIIL